MDLQKEKIRNLVNGVYDTQKLRIATGNRIVQSFNIQMGQKPSTKQDDMDEKAQKLIDSLRKEYKLITDAYIDKKGSIEKLIKTNQELSYIKSKIDYDLIGTYVDLVEVEEKTLRILEREVKSHPMWDKFFKDVKGCGTLMAAVCLSYIDINKARHVSSVWRYAGLDTVDVVLEDGTVKNEGRSAKKAHNREQIYFDKDGNQQVKMGLGYNPILKTKLIGVLGSCMLKAGLRVAKDDNKNPILDAEGNKQYVASSIYVQAYLDYRNRLNNRADADTLTEAHKYNMAVRYMVKQFLRDLWCTWRAMEGYEVSEPYEVAKLGYKPHKYNEYHERIAQNSK